MNDPPELPLEWLPYDHYKVEIRNGPLFEEKALRSHKAESVADAVSLIEGLRDTYAARAEVVWQAEEVNGEGKLFGLAPEGVVWVIQVTPPLSTPLG